MPRQPFSRQIGEFVCSPADRAFATVGPTVEKLAELLHAIAPDREILVDLGKAA